MAQAKIDNKPRSAPRHISVGGQKAEFDMVAPITGDWIYLLISEKRGNIHYIVTNPGARERQARWLGR